ncbi:hypothetical protein [Sphingomonas bacterium]|uniref:hypothetical protein n=1 Tax=Sphingomonas bacterium TaxID=1895847 RepID=UPI0015770614|nr:hypothetical protein [Sphingomonas bacterium]
MNAARSTDDVPTLIAVGAAVAITASLAHEALGHGVGCIADGGTVTLLTFLVFRCAGAGVLADGGGPVGAFLVAALCLILVRRLRPAPSVASLFGYALGVQTMLWVCAQMIREGIDGGDDWGHVAADLTWAPAWHVVVIALGVGGYAATIRIAARLGVFLASGKPERLLVPYISACLFATAFGALWHGDPAASALDGLLSFGMAPLGYLLAIRAVARTADVPSLPPVERSYAWLVSVAVIAATFALTIARGIGRLA